ncbi:protein phosphatase, putative [Entamoeba histolytica HM-1:IMSS-B]|uniref:Protein phosphatase, putative n=7 Tax=Entamoeba histolytica TaxID=5759 RepID=A0A8U0WPE9_ENTH1|nr:protein phosphatase, putative [Entamoeba histolytica HM-1:IMSS]EMD49008.1 protein phosphatase, putative [Entamoeba histolytica KU27]EMH73085.1 protein phosphatase, putative [Entamoeba histolytica HM-1:IMSS-B]EMS14694.1 protein phosphatase 2C-2, putative [Entamoeba histolytica HM-3:IMSS]ENY63115.1 protein phosphatase 2C-2, putative [Entamoeba histolytica HM-1:IMSS-A]BAB62146.1 protein phosphatase 2C-2 [Entamoeba histolytica]|eukprot:XP_652777.1 protein phosphatase, putative [Entamoeba histolytica HM-1:IMSS]
MNISTEQIDPLDKEAKQYKKYSFKEKKKLKTIAGGASDIGVRPANEDTFRIIPNAQQLVPMKKNKKMGCEYYGLFDGHNGLEASKFCAELMHEEILEDPDFVNGYYENCMVNAYYRMDWLLCNYHIKDNSGCTSVTALIQGRYLVVANVGDSECLVIKCRYSNEVEVLTYKHTAKDESEKQRMKSKGGIVFNGRVYGSMVVSRSLGDKTYKGKGVVIPEPYINIYELTSDDKIIVLACDGVFEKMSYDDVMEYVCTQKQQGKNPQEVARNLIQEAIARGSKDNVTAVIIFLNWC